MLKISRLINALRRRKKGESDADYDISSMDYLEQLLYGRLQSNLGILWLIMLCYKLEQSDLRVEEEIEELLKEKSIIKLVKGKFKDVVLEERWLQAHFTRENEILIELRKKLEIQNDLLKMLAARKETEAMPRGPETTRVGPLEDAEEKKMAVLEALGYKPRRRTIRSRILGALPSLRKPKGPTGRAKPPSAEPKLTEIVKKEEIILNAISQIPRQRINLLKKEEVENLRQMAEKASEELRAFEKRDFKGYTLKLRERSKRLGMAIMGIASYVKGRARDQRIAQAADELQRLEAERQEALGEKPEAPGAVRFDFDVGVYAIQKGIKGERKMMEDANYFEKNFAGREGCLFAGVYDGHGGNEGSKIAAQDLHEIFKESLMGGIDVKSSFENAYTRVSNEIRKSFDSGTTAANIFIGDGTLFIAHAGDSKVIVCANDKVIFATTDHNVHNKIEKKRAESEGGVFNENGRLNTILLVTRALGDKRVGPGLSHLPEVSSISLSELTGKGTVRIIICCDGVFSNNALTVEGTASIANNYNNSQRSADAIVGEASRNGSKDNITAMVIILIPKK